MNHFELEKLREASGLFNKLLGMLNDYLVRTVEPGRPGSQGEEDKILQELLPGNGRYVDFGAARPRNNSNTWTFYERGWRGLLVEPNTSFLYMLNYRRPGDKVYPVAVRNYKGQTPFHIRGEVSSVISSWTESEPHRIDVDSLAVCERTDELLAKFPEDRDQCRFCSIDVEGAERELLETIDWSTFQPEVFCIEYRRYDPVKLGEDMSGEWKGLLEAQGYKEVARTALNIICKRDENATEA